MSKEEGLKRVELYKEIPLETPYAIQIWVSNICNFRCNYCIQALPDDELKKIGFKKELLPYSLFMKIIDQLVDFKQKVKTINLAGQGEPLLHPKIVDMVRYAKKEEVAERIEIVTNAFFLTPELSDQLIDAGVDRLRISIEGVSNESYKRICKVDLNIEDILDNIRYFYKNKLNTVVYMKTVDSALMGESDYEKFNNMFKGIADYINVEHVAPFFNQIDYSCLQENPYFAIRGNAVEDMSLCPMSFYTLAIHTDGNVYPCCYVPDPIFYGNIKVCNLKHCWENAINFQLRQLITGGGVESIPICMDCKMGRYISQPEDYLDLHKHEIVKKYRKKFIQKTVFKG